MRRGMVVAACPFFGVGCHIHRIWMALVAQGMVRMGRGGRLRPLSRASLMRWVTMAGLVRMSWGEKCRGTMPAAPIRV